MFASLSLPALISLFVVAAAAVWVAGVQLSKTTDCIDLHFGLGEAFGGLVFLAVTTNLPEIAIVVSAALARDLGLAIGNILGGIALQTVVLVVLDGYGLRSKAALSYQAASLQLVLEGVLVIMVLVISIMGSQLRQTVMFGRFAPGDIMIVIAWLTGLWLISKARTQLPWQEKGLAPHTKGPIKKEKTKEKPIGRVLVVFFLAALITLVAGYVLEESSRRLAAQIGMSGVIFGSTILAAATSLPEISTGLAAVKIGDYTMAISDIFGGNAFLPVLFLPATLISGQSLLPQAQNSDIYLASLGALLTAVYIYGLIFRPKRQFFCLGVDSLVVLLIYALGIIGLFAVSA